jgi:agmatine/peptidylarginine deiminase
MFTRRSLPLMLAVAVLLTGAGFLAGKWVQDYRTAAGNLGFDVENQASVRPIPELATTGRIIGGFEHQAATILGVNGLLRIDPEMLVQIISAIHDRIKIIGVVKNAEQRAQVIELLKSRRLPETSVHYFQWPVESMWVRDYAPYFLVGEHTTVIDFTYAKPDRDLEDAFAPAFAASFNLHYTHSGLTFEGGDLISNGDGLCITTPGSFTSNSARGYDVNRIGEILHDQFHFARWIRLDPLNEEPTGHVDMFVTLCAKNKAVLGVCSRDEDPINAEILDRSASAIKGEPTSSGPMEVVRIPMPSHRDGVWRTYTNVIYANGIVLVPQYPDSDPKLDKMALEVFQSALPTWKVVGINCSKLVAQRGGMHRISRHVPSLENAK